MVFWRLRRVDDSAEGLVGGRRQDFLLQHPLSFGALGSRRFLTLTWVNTYRRDSQVTAQKKGGNLGHRPHLARATVKSVRICSRK